MSFLALLSGFSEGAGSEIAKQGEEKRKNKVRQDELLADSIHKRLETDDTLDFPSYASLRGQEYQLRGVDKKHIGTLLDHEKSIWDHAQSLKQAKTPGTAATSVLPQPGNAQGAVDQETGMPVGAQPGSQTDAKMDLPGLPPMPQAPVTSGDLRAGASASAKSITDEEVIQKQRKLMDLFNEQDRQSGATDTDNGSVESEGTPHAKTKRSMGLNGITESRENEQPKYQPGAISGEDVLKQFPNARGIDPSGWYKKGSFTDGSVRHSPTQPTTTSKVVYDETSPTTASQVKVDPKNKIVGEPLKGVQAPPNWSEKDTERDGISYKVNPVTGQMEPYVSTTHVKVVAQINGAKGAKATPISPIPSAKVGTGTASNVASKTPGQIGLYGSPHGTMPDPGGKAPSVGGKTIDSDTDLKVNYLTGQVASGRMKMADVKGDGSKLSQKQMQGLVQDNLANRGLDVNKITTSQLDTAQFAKSLEDHLPEIYSEIDNLDQNGKLGLFASRYNEFMRGVGYENISPTDKATFTKLQTDLGLINTALMKIHTGSRGSTTIMTKFADLINGGKMTAPVLKEAVHAAGNWVHTYSQLVPSGEDALNKRGMGRGATPNTPVPSSTKTINTKVEYDAIPSGASYIDASDGKSYTKR